MQRGQTLQQPQPQKPGTWFQWYLHSSKLQPWNSNKAQARTNEALQKLWDPGLTEEKFRAWALGSVLIAVPWTQADLSGLTKDRLRQQVQISWLGFKKQYQILLSSAASMGDAYTKQKPLTRRPSIKTEELTNGKFIIWTKQICFRNRKQYYGKSLSEIITLLSKKF